MVLVDTSVWSVALCDSAGSYKVRLQLECLLDAYAVSMTDNIRFEILSMIKNEHRGELLSLLSCLNMVKIKPSTWNLALQICWDLQSKALNPSVVSCLVTAAALQMHMPLFTFNEEQKAVAEIRKLSLIE